MPPLEAKLRSTIDLPAGRSAVLEFLHTSESFLRIYPSILTATKSADGFFKGRLTYAVSKVPVA